MQANLDCSGWELPEADYQALSNLDYQARMVDGSFLLNPRGPYTTLVQLWDE